MAPPPDDLAEVGRAAPRAVFAAGLVRAVLTVAAGLAFLLMHGLDPVDTASAHFAVRVEPVGWYPDPVTLSIPVTADDATDRSEQHGSELVGCVLMLVATIGLLALLRRFLLPVRSVPEDGFGRRYRDHPPRGPPLSICLAYCVFRL